MLVTISYFNSPGVEEIRKKQFITGIRKKTDKFMVEIFETFQTKSIVKQMNKDESLFIRSIIS